ncbi:hypothetical protein Acsp06_00090 [Actinomycetospora sp. NBRC 106375]|uniref:DUF742 domain-containing protein n=1 Tax=Actinomycetospora sp. NBRC 106375 TaxID=3032207 RepID=UPI00249FA72B|nr:DUF742 domain-containing protein [Actinomycetospora sp. NBRC 106375]GLZ43824.1 hypothetical protein Acsp06_00090 [Actinomycetospora sp. NBRC 106375]
MTEGDGDQRRRRARVGRTGARFPRIADDQLAELVSDLPEPPEPPGGTVPSDDRIGRTGARFNSRGRRARREAERTAAEDAAVPAQALPPARRQPEPDDAPTLPLFVTSTAPPESTRTRVRPYVRTRGRTRSRSDLAVETLVSIPSPRPPLEDPEHVALGDVVADPRSVAEVAALLSVPLGVARVIIDDMAGAGLLLVHPRAVAATGAPSRDMMQRVLDGLHRL